jgi:uncharacterized protein with GYD domain
MPPDLIQVNANLVRMWLSLRSLRGLKFDARVRRFLIGSSKQIFFRRDAMTIYISRGRFTSDAVKGMVTKPENREEAVSKLCESVGGRLIGWYLTMGHHDWLAIAEFPDDKAAASAILAAAAGGSLTDIETTPAMTAKDAHATFVSAGKAAKTFRSAGRA